LFAWEEEVIHEMEGNACGVRPKLEASDGWIWLLNNVHEFSVSSYYKHLISLINVQSSDPILIRALEKAWEIDVSSKAKVMIWSYLKRG